MASMTTPNMLFIRHIAAEIRHVKDAMTATRAVSNAIIKASLLESFMLDRCKMFRKFLNRNKAIAFPAQHGNLYRLAVRSFGTLFRVVPTKMTVKALFKGITYELLSDPAFMRIASKELRLPG